MSNLNEIIMGWANLFCIAVLGASLISCGHSSKMSKSVVVVDANNAPVQGALVIPLVSERKWAALGAGSLGPESSSSRSLKEPFTWNSGDELIPAHLESRSMMIFPALAVGNSVYVSSWLVLKQGYAPLTIDYSQGRLIVKGQKSRQR